MSEVRRDLVSADIGTPGTQGVDIFSAISSAQAETHIYYPDWENGFLYSTTGTDGRWLGHRWEGFVETTSIQTITLANSLAEMRLLTYI